MTTRSESDFVLDMAECREILQDEEKTDEQRMLELANKIVGSINFGNWRLLGISLGLEEHQLQDIELEFVSQKPNILEVCYQLIRQWKQKSPEEFSEKLLTEVAEKIKTCEETSKIINSQVSTQTTINEELKALRSTIECLQKTEYQDRPMPVSPWIEERNLPLQELYVDLDMFPTDTEGNELQQVSMSLENIFDPVNDKDQSVRILVEGDAGYGKTTLAQKIVEDWTKDIPYVSDKFRMIFFFYLRNCSCEDTFENLIREECEALGVDRDKGLQCVKCFESEILFLLDGYDELVEQSKVNFEKLLRKKEFRTSTVVVTSRRGIIKIEKENPKAKGLTRKKGSGGNRLNFWHKRILIKGIAHENRSVFLQKFFQCDIKDDIFQKLSIIADLELYRCPLFLILLATLRDEENIDSIKTETTLFQFLINVVTRRGLLREGMIDEEEDIELFNSEQSNYHEECARQMAQFGKLALGHMIQDKMTFSEAEIETCCGKSNVFLKLGFLNRYVTFDNRRPKSSFQPIHKSILEFFIAYNLFRLANKSVEIGGEFFKEEIVHMMKNDQIPNDSSLIYPFLAGLLNEKSYLLFQALSPWIPFYDAFSQPILAMLNEIKNPSELIPLFLPTIPTCFGVSRRVKKFCSDARYLDIVSLIFEVAIESSRLHGINWDLDNILCFPFIQVSIKHLMIKYMHMKALNFDLPTFFPKVKCEHLCCRFLKIDQNHWDEIADYIFTIEAETFDIQLLSGSKCLVFIHKEMMKGRWQQVTLQRLELIFDGFLDEDNLLLLNDLLKTNRICQRLHLRVDEVCETETTRTFFELVCDRLTDFLFLSNSSYVSMFSFSRLCENGKQWKRLLFSDGFTYDKACVEEKNLFCSVKEIILEELDVASAVFVMNRCVDVLHLMCDSDVIFPCIADEWSSIQSIQTLHLTIFEGEFNFLRLLQLSKLSVLSLHLKSCVDSTELRVNGLNLGSYVQKSNIDILEFEWHPNPHRAAFMSVFGPVKEDREKTTEDTFPDVFLMAMLRNFTKHNNTHDYEHGTELSGRKKYAQRSTGHEVNRLKELRILFSEGMSQTLSLLKQALKEKYVENLVLFMNNASEHAYQHVSLRNFALEHNFKINKSVVCAEMEKGTMLSFRNLFLDQDIPTLVITYDES